MYTKRWHLHCVYFYLHGCFGSVWFVLMKLIWYITNTLALCNIMHHFNMRVLSISSTLLCKDMYFIYLLISRYRNVFRTNWWQVFFQSFMIKRATLARHQNHLITTKKKYSKEILKYIVRKARSGFSPGLNYYPFLFEGYLDIGHFQLDFYLFVSYPQYCFYISKRSFENNSVLKLMTALQLFQKVRLYVCPKFDIGSLLLFL